MRECIVRVLVATLRGPQRHAAGEDREEPVATNEPLTP